MNPSKISQTKLISKKADETRLNLAKIKNIGKASLELTDNELNIKSLDSVFNYTKNIKDIDYLLYSKGNFLLNDKFYIGIGGNQFEVNCQEDENEFKNFYYTIKKKKNNIQANTNLLNQENNTTQENTEKPENTEKINISEEIRNFHNLMKEGIITEEEFEEKKKELLKMKIQ